NNIKREVRGRLLVAVEHPDVGDQQIIGLVGDNGSGKTNLLKIIEGSMIPEEGVSERNTKIEIVPQLERISDEKSGGEITQSYIQDALNQSAGLLLLDEHTTH